MSELSRRTALVFIVGLCVAGLSLHFVVESLGGQENFIGGQIQGTSDSHEEDQFIPGELGDGNLVQKWISRPFMSKLKIISRSLPPLRQPPKSI